MRIFSLVLLCLASILNLAYAQTIGDYRSNVTTGNWHVPANWEVLSSVAPEVWVTASSNPPATAGLTITIRAGHSITIAAGAGAVTLNNNLTIATGGTLTVNNASNSAANDLIFGATGVLRVNGVLNIAATSPTNGNSRISLPSGGTTFVSGTLNNAGTTASFIPNSGTVEFSGSPASITGNSFSFFNVVIDPSTTLNVNSGTPVTINQDLTNDGTFNPGNTFTVKGTLTNNGTFNAGTTVTLDGGNDLVPNDFVNNGTFNAGSGSVNFNSAVQVQNITGAATLTSFNNININNGFGVNVETAVALMGALNLGDGAIFDADGSSDAGVLTVRSSGVSSGGRIGDLTGKSDNFIGNVTIERFVNGPDTWRYLSMPITDGTVAMWKDDFPVTGSFSDPSPENVDGVTHSNAASIYSFDPSTGQYVAIGSGTSTGGTPLSNAIGYSAYSYKTGDFTISVRGTIGKGDVPVSVSTGNGGYNLVPNPYPSAIDWDNVTKTGLANAMWIRTGNNQFASYVGGVAANVPFGGWTGEVATGQSFWVQSTSASTLTFQEDDKTAGQYRFLREAAPRDYMRVTMLAPVVAGQRQADDAVIRFVDNAIEGFDASYDARKLKNGGINLSSYATIASEDYAINSLPLLQCAAKNIKLKVDGVNAGNYTLRFGDFDKMDVGYGVTLVDKFLNREVAVNEGTEYDFEVTADALSKGAGRFELSFTPVSIDLQRDLELTAAQDCANPMVKLELDNSQLGVQYVFKLDNNNLHDAMTGNGGKISALVSKSMLTSGMNKLSLAASSAFGCDVHTFNEALSVKIDQLYEVSAVTGGQHCGTGSVTVSAAGAPLDGSYKWYESSTAVEAIAGASESTFTTPVLTESRTYFVSLVNASGCESEQRLAVEAKIAAINNVTAVTGGQTCGEGSVTLVAEGAPKLGAYKWYESSMAVEAIAGASEPTFTTPVLAESRIYFVSVVNSAGCESLQRHPVEAKVVRLPAPEIVAHGSLLTVSYNEGVQWYKDNVAIDGATANEYEVKATGLYSTVVTKDGCSVGSQGFSFIVSGVEDKNSQFRFYPNPTSDFLHIANVPPDATVSVYDNQGRAVKTPLDVHKDGVTIDMRELGKGLYMFSVGNHGQCLRVKVIKN